MAQGHRAASRHGDELPEPIACPRPFPRYATPQTPSRRSLRGCRVRGCPLRLALGLGPMAPSGFAFGVRPGLSRCSSHGKDACRGEVFYVVERCSM